MTEPKKMREATREELAALNPADIAIGKPAAEGEVEGQWADRVLCFRCGNFMVFPRPVRWVCCGVCGQCGPV